jgi:hypothetical protein
MRFAASRLLVMVPYQLKRNFFIESVFIGVCLQIFEKIAFKLTIWEFKVSTFFIFSQKFRIRYSSQFDKFIFWNTMDNGY